MECLILKSEVLRNDIAGAEENESQPECFTDEIILFNELDIPGASINGKKPCQLKVTQLKRWLACMWCSFKWKKASAYRTVS